MARAGLVALTGKVGAWPNSKKEEEDYLSRQCCGSMTFWCGSGSGSADPRLRIMDPDPDPAIFVRTFNVPTKNKFLKKSFFAYYFLKVHLKKSKRSHKAVGIKVFLTIFAY